MTVALITPGENGADDDRALRILKSMRGFGWSADPSGCFTYVSPNALAFLGHAPEELGTIENDEFGWRRVVHPDDYDRVAARWRNCLRTGDPYETEHRLRGSDGVYRWFRNSGSASRDADGRITQWYGTTLDIEDQKRAETALRDRERELSKLVDMVPVHIRRLTPEGEPIFFNKRLRDFFGLDVADFEKPQGGRLATVIRTLVHPEDADGLLEAVRRSVRTGEPYSMKYRMRRADGEYRWVDGRAEPVRDETGAVVQWFAISIDVDDEMHAQEALRGREQELAQLVDMVPSHVWRLRPDGEPMFFNKRMVDFIGLDVADLDEPGTSRLEGIIGTVHPEDAADFGSTLRRCLATGENFAMRYRLRRADGAFHWMSSRAEPMQGPDGRIVQWYGLCHDIDDQVKAEEALRRSEGQLRRLVDSNVIGIVIWDLDGRLIEANDAFLGMIQYEREELQAGLRWFDMTPPEWQEVHARDEAEELARTGVMQPREKEYFRKDGSRVPVLIGAACFEGQSRQGVAYILDLTERKRAEAALRDRERELARLVDTVPVQLWSVSPGGDPAYINKTMMDYIGLKFEDFDARGGLPAAIQTIVHPDDRTALLQGLARSFDTGERFELKFRNRRWDGAYRWTEGHADPLRDESGRIIRWYGANVDIDDLVKSQEALEISRQQLEQMIDAVPFSILSFDPSGKLTYASKRYLEQAGAPPADIEDFDALARDVAHPEDFPAMFHRARDGFATGQPFVNRFRRRLKDGEYRWIEARAHPLRDTSGEIAQWYFASIDIEDEMRAQEALRERERFLWQLVETLPAMIDCASPDGEPVYRSRQLREFLGYDLEELDAPGISRLTHTLDTGVHPDDLAGVKEMYARSLATGEPYARRHRLRRHDGEYRWVETRAAPMRYADGVIVQWNVICLDIDGEMKAQDELRLARERLASASQAASLAELSASIAHEVNQPLMAVVAYANACQRWLQADPPNIERAQRTMERTIHSATIAADVVSRIRSLFRHATDDRNATTMDSLVIAARDLMAEEAARLKVRVDVRIEDGLPSVPADRVQIQQVLVKLMRNGMEAMDLVDGDRILEMRVSRDEGMVRTEVSDRGPGIQHADRLFEPFFTTKQAGMGMGLAICRSIVESHGGRLWGENDERQGARFVFVLPVAGAPPP